jgi:hypothetical protein
MNLIATCGICTAQENLGEEPLGVKVNKGVERWCAPCKKTTWQFIGEERPQHAQHESLISGGRGTRR